MADEEEWVPPPEEEVARPTRRSAVLATQRLSAPRRIRVKFTKEFADEIVSFVKQNRPRALTFEEKLDTLLLQKHLRQKHLEHLSKNKNGYKRNAPRYSEQVAEILQRGKNTVAETWADYVKHRRVTVYRAPGNFNRKRTLVPHTRKVLRIIREFLRKRRETRTRTVAKDVLDLLLTNGILPEVQRNNKKSMRSALRGVQRYCVSKGFKRGSRKKGCQHYRLSEHNIIARDKYVVRMMNEYAKRKRRVVYMDDSYIHKNYCRHDDSLYDPNDEQDLQTTPFHEGQRYCFIAAIVDADYTVAEKDRSATQKAHLMKDTLHIFEGGSRNNKKKATKDYHGMFDFVYFKNWMETLLLALEKRNIENAIIIMNKAKYPKNTPPDTPKRSQKKATLQEACRRYGLSFELTDTKALLWSKLKVHIEENVKPVIVSMAQEKGHEVLFSPPHFSDLQPIQIVWANVKGEVGRQYTTETTFAQVKERLQAAFDHLKSETVAGCIRTANRHLSKLYEHITKMDLVDEADDNAAGAEDADDNEDADEENSNDEEDDDDEDEEEEEDTDF